MPETKGLSLLQIREMYLGKHTKTISIPVFKDAENKDTKTTSIPIFKDAENKDAKARAKADDEDDEKQDMLTSSV
jgi:hypothetical protein